MGPVAASFDIPSELARLQGVKKVFIVAQDHRPFGLQYGYQRQHNDLSLLLESNIPLITSSQNFLER